MALLNALVLTGGGVLAALLTAAIAIIATYWYQGMVVEATVDILDGRRDHTIGSLFSSAAPFIGPLFLAGLLAGIGIAIGFVLLIVPGLFLLTIWSVIVPVIVIERTGRARGLRAQPRVGAWQRLARVRRDRRAVPAGVAIVGGVVDAIVGGLTDESFVGYALADLIVNMLLAPLTAIAATVIYVELRRVKGRAAGRGRRRAARPRPCRPRMPRARSRPDAETPPR